MISAYIRYVLQWKKNDNFLKILKLPRESFMMPWTWYKKQKTLQLWVAAAYKKHNDNKWLLRPACHPDNATAPSKGQTVVKYSGTRYSPVKYY